MTQILTSSLTEAIVDGNGVFDVLMKTVEAHLVTQFDKNRIKGSEYATVYLGSLESVLKNSVDFLLQKEKSGLEGDLIKEQILLAKQELLKSVQQTALVTQQAANAILEGEVLKAQKCKLDAEYDNLLVMKLKTVAETSLLSQKAATEKAQITSLGVDADSVVGRQKSLYQAQTDGFKRDAEQKVAKIMVDSWNVRRTTDEGTVADGVNNLNDTAVGRAVNALLNGVNA